MGTDDYFQQLFSGIVVSPLDWTSGIALVATIILLLVSAFMSGSEVAFFSLGPAQLEEIKSKKDKRDEALFNLLADSERLLGTVLVGNNFVNVAIVMLASVVVDHCFDFTASPTLGFIVQVVVLTFILLLFGEIIPKIYCQTRPLEFSRFAAKYMRPVVKMLSPFTKILVWMGDRVTRTFSRKTFDLSADDLSTAIDLTTESDEEKGLLNEIVRFYRKTASEVMTPRIDVAAIEWHTKYSEVLNFVVDKRYSRVPVYDEGMDNVKGLLYIKDLLPHLDEDDTFQWQNLLRPVIYVPESKRVDNLLEEFREQKVHMAIVVDEFGGTSGLVTMEDLLEEIVGEISDEYDEEDVLYETQADGTIIFDAKTPLLDFFRISKIELTEAIEEMLEEVDTIGGMLLEVKGDFPTVGEVITIDGYNFTVLEMGRRRISKVKFEPVRHVATNKEE